MSKEVEVITSDVFSEHVLHTSNQLGITILESIGLAVEKFNIEEESVKRLLTEYLLSRLTAECADARLLKGVKRSVKIV